MTLKFQNKYRIPSARASWWDYGANGYYFVTICTAGHECCFGNVVAGEMCLSEIGKLAQQYWLDIPKHFPFIQLHSFVVMPNHVHGIIVIDKQNDDRINERTVETPYMGVSIKQIINQETSNHIVSLNNKPIQNTETPKLGVSTVNASMKWDPGILGVIINQYKRICTIHARKTYPYFAWQTRFHDHIIKTDEAYQLIARYIENNPMNWAADKFFI
jgi:putative transposase